MELLRFSELQDYVVNVDKTRQLCYKREEFPFGVVVQCIESD